MSTVFIVGDPHLGHKAIGKYRNGVSDAESNTEKFIEEWNSTVKKKVDKVFVLGDVAWDLESLAVFKQLQGRKVLVIGNHDTLKTEDYLYNGFEKVVGVISYKQCWMSHVPIHPMEMRRKQFNLHAHTHDKCVNDARYLNASIDNLEKVFDGRWIVTYREIEELMRNKLGSGIYRD